MPYRVPLVYTARRPFTANGETFDRGDVLTADQARPLRLGLLVSSGHLIASPDPHARRGSPYVAPMPTTVPGDAYPSDEALTAGVITVTPDPDPGDELRVILDADFEGPIGWAFGDGYADYQQDNHTAHPYGAAGTYTVVAQSTTHKATVSVTVPHVVEDPEGGAQQSVGPEPDALAAGATVADTLEWVGEDPVRAQIALDAEQTRDKPRVTLIEALNTILGAGQDAPA